MQLDLASALPPVFSATAWHYTTTNGFIGIVRDGKLWATGIAHLNDARELEYALDTVRSAWATIRSSFEDETDRFVDTIMSTATGAASGGSVFVACASKNRDDLGQWRGYGDYAVGIDASVRLAPGVSLSTGIAGDGHWRDVLYDPREQFDACERVLRVVAGMRERIGPYAGVEPEECFTSAYFLLGTLMPLLKHRGFASECEVRCSTTKPFFTQPSFRPGRFSVVPYLEMRPLGGSLLPISRVLVGPTPHMDTAVNGAKELLDAFDYVVDQHADPTERETIAVDPSDIAFRT